jgi:hypothetical protein
MLTETRPVNSLSSLIGEETPAAVVKPLTPDPLSLRKRGNDGYGWREGRDYLIAPALLSEKYM